jgi:hypothetical protein
LVGSLRVLAKMDPWALIAAQDIAERLAKYPVTKDKACSLPLKSLKKPLKGRVLTVRLVT